MKLNPATAKVTDIRVYYDKARVVTSKGRIIWATVEIYYTLQGMTPDITIRLPVQCEHDTGLEARRMQVLKSAHALLKHVCNSVAMTSSEETGGNALVTIP